jgi:hypothetical protein
VEAGKVAKHKATCEAVGWDFAPFAANPWGALGAQGAKILKSLLHSATEHILPDQRGLKKAELRGLVSVALQSQVARQLKVVYDITSTLTSDLPLTSLYHDHTPADGYRMEVDPCGNEVFVPM